MSGLKLIETTKSDNGFVELLKTLDKYELNAILEEIDAALVCAERTNNKNTAIIVYKSYDLSDNLNISTLIRNKEDMEDEEIYDIGISITLKTKNPDKSIRCLGSSELGDCTIDEMRKVRDIVLGITLLEDPN